MNQTIPEELINLNIEQELHTPDDSNTTDINNNPTIPTVVYTESDLPTSSLVTLATLTKEQDYRIAGILWLRGYNIVDIARIIKSSTREVLDILRETRSNIAEWHKDEIENIRSERIEGFRQVQRRAWLEFELAKPGIKAQLLSIVMKAEETIAKMQGVIENKIKHSGTIDHRYKQYDFNNDNFPEAVEIEAVNPEK